MQVSYKKLDGSVQVFTANTAIATTKLLGNYTPGWTYPNLKAELETLATSSEVRGGITYYYLTSTQYVLDYGLNIWAKERLSSDDYTKFSNDCVKLFADATADPTWNGWWHKFETDPNVTITNT